MFKPICIILTLIRWGAMQFEGGCNLLIKLETFHWLIWAQKALVHKESPCIERKHLESGQRVSLHAIPTFKTFQIEKNASNFLLNSCSCCSISWSSKYVMARITSDTQPKWKYLPWINRKKISSRRFMQRQPGSAMYHGPQSFYPLLQLSCKIGKKCQVNMWLHGAFYKNLCCQG